MYLGNTFYSMLNGKCLSLLNNYCNVSIVKEENPKMYLTKTLSYKLYSHCFVEGDSTQSIYINFAGEKNEFGFEGTKLTFINVFTTDVCLVMCLWYN
jgi:hypothetical protein